MLTGDSRKLRTGWRLVNSERSGSSDWRASGGCGLPGSVELAGLLEVDLDSG